MEDPRTFKQIMANPRRDECEARLRAVMDELATAGHSPNDIAHAGMTTAIETVRNSRQELVFLRSIRGVIETLANRNIPLVGHMNELSDNLN